MDEGNVDQFDLWDENEAPPVTEPIKKAIVVDKPQELEEYQKLLDKELTDIDPDIPPSIYWIDFPCKYLIHEKSKEDFMRVAFDIFALANPKDVGEEWLDYLTYKKLLFMARIIPNENFPDHKVDLVYSQMSFKNGEFTPIVYSRFKELISKVAMIRYSEDFELEATQKLMRYYLFPFLLLEFDEMHDHLPHEWLYLQFLIGKKKKEKDNKSSQVGLKKLLSRLGSKMEEDDSPSKRKNLSLDDDYDFPVNTPKRSRFGKTKKKKTKKALKKMMTLKKAGSEEQGESRKVRCGRALKDLVFACFLTPAANKDDEEPDELELNTKPIYVNGEKQEFNHEPSPEWPEICGIMVRSIQNAEEEFKRKQADEDIVRFNWNITNVIVLISRFIEYYSLGSLAFNPAISWSLTDTQKNTLNVTNGNFATGIV